MFSLWLVACGYYFGRAINIDFDFWILALVWLTTRSMEKLLRAISGARIRCVIAQPNYVFESLPHGCRADVVWAEFMVQAHKMTSNRCVPVPICVGRRMGKRVAGICRRTMENSCNTLWARAPASIVANGRRETNYSSQSVEDFHFSVWIIYFHFVPTRCSFN